MAEPIHPPLEQMEAGLENIRESPKEAGVLRLIVRRPATEEREVLTEGRLDPADGLVGDNWKARGSRGPRTARQIQNSNSPL